MLFLKVHRYAEFLQFPHRFQQNQRISGKPTDRFGEDPVDLARPARFQQTLKLWPRILRPRVRLIRIYARERPSRMLLDVCAVIAYLLRERVQHGFLPG